MSDGYEIASVDDVEALGFRPAGLQAWSADAGGELVPPHTPDADSEELYVVVRGRATFTVGDEQADAPAGTLVFAPGAVFRSATAGEDGTTVFAAGGTVGKAFAS